MKMDNFLQMLLILVLVLIKAACAEEVQEEKLLSPAETQRYDGWYNNLGHPEWGSVESRLSRRSPPAYADGVYEMSGQERPSPRALSQALMRGRDGMASARNLTVLFTFFGQVVASEVVLSSESGCPIELHHIEVEQCDPGFDSRCEGSRRMPFRRAAYDPATGHSPNSPREQINRVTSWIDGSFVYSTSESWADSMRLFINGSLRMEGAYPPLNTARAPLHNAPPAHHPSRASPERMFLLGDPRSNQNPALLSMGILLYRWHNVVAERVLRLHPDWSDEDVFQRARRWVVASLQNIILYEYIPALLDEEITPYTGYKPDVHPGISHEFQSAAFRFSHTLIPPGLYARDGKCNFKTTPTGHPAIRLCSTWWNSEEVVKEIDLEQLLMGMASQISEREDAVLCSDVRDKLFGPLDFSRRDLAALNIMRGRDNGLPDYNTVRRYFGLSTIESWEDINPALNRSHPELFEALSEAYAYDLDAVDAYVGGMLESVGGPGELFKAVIKEQFQRLRDADRFWFENTATGLFTDSEIGEIRRIRLRDIIVQATDITSEELQEDIFLFKEGDVCPQPGQLNASHLEPCMTLEGRDYFHGNEVAYIYTCMLLAFIPIVCGAAGYGVIKLQNKRRRQIKLRKDKSTPKNAADKLYVKEWLHQNHKRCVKAKIGPGECVTTLNRKGEMLRRVDLSGADSELVIEITPDAKKPLLLIRSPRDHDLVLQFEHEQSRSKFLAKLEHFLSVRNKKLVKIDVDREEMLKNAETKEKRQKRLEHFFREAYALAFGLSGKKQQKQQEAEDLEAVMRCSLSKGEFADALGMRPDSLFVKRMFNCVDKDKDGRISFQEFLDTVDLFSRGRTESKLRVIFDMCDDEGQGVIDKEELTRMLGSLVDIARTRMLDDQQVLELIRGMFSASGLDGKDRLDYDDFRVLMREFKGENIAIGLDMKGAKQNFLDTSSNVARVTSFQLPPEAHTVSRGWWGRKWDTIITFLEEYRQHVFYVFVFYVANIVLFLERFIFYSYLAEHGDLRRVMGAGIAATRGSAAALSLCYALLPLTVCRNLITAVREVHVVRQFFPLDAHIPFHRMVAKTALFWTVIHTVGHCINFYHISTQPLDHLRCLTKEMHFDSDFKPSVAFWLFRTVTGLTGVLLFSIVCIMFVFAHSRIREKAYSFFWATHSLYAPLYALMLLHGLAKLTGSPRFWIFFVGPAIIFTLDKIVSLQTKYMELDILGTELLPSDVTKVKFSRPPHFKYLSGQWVRLCCTAFRQGELHSFTLTSAPHENHLSVHVKAHGPWTWRLRNHFDPANLSDGPLPKIRLEGPFGGGNQDWYKFEVAVMVGGGIGVTPYASILSDLVFGTSTNRYSGVACKKVYFLWICPSHRHFEWFIDVLRDVERRDVTSVLEIHIFITQFFHKFDLRTTMLYICETHFQRISDCSMFTGLKAVNHFGRPDIIAFLKFVQRQHTHVSKVGVFSCGPSPMTKNITKACETVNRSRKLPYFAHHFENF